MSVLQQVFGKDSKDTPHGRYTSCNTETLPLHSISDSLVPVSQGNSIIRKTAPSHSSEHDSGLLQPDYPYAVNNSQKVLLVEDYPGNILVATTLLKELEYAYNVAHNGQEALALQDQAPYFAVLMDVNMPIMDGFEATSIWRKREQSMGWPHTHIIGLTAHTFAGDEVRCLEAGMDSYLAKPLTLEILQSVLDNVSSLVQTPKTDR